MRRLIVDHYVPVKVDGRRARALRNELKFSWAGDLLLVRADRFVLRRLGDGDTATTAQVRAELRRLTASAARTGGEPEPDVPSLVAALRSKSADGASAAAHETLARVLAAVPPFDRTGLPALSERLVRFLEAWWALYRDALAWRADLGRYEYRRPDADASRGESGKR